jgi:Ca2+-binding RTX toxin-like protein
MTYTQTDRNIYYSVGGGGLVSARTNASTPGVYDVAAIEYMYGAITDANTGNTVYSYGDWNPDNPFLIRTLVDSGGTDTIDASSQTRASIIDLSPGSFSSIGIYSLAEQQTYFRTLTGLSYTLSSAGSDLYTGEDNLGIAFSATIENAYGGAGNDTITGNTADNTLRGNGGNDTIDGGAGTDVAVFSRDYSEYSITESGGTVTVTHNGSGADGTDTLTNIEFIDFADKRYTVGTGELARAGGLVIPVKEGLFSSERQAARLQQAREELNAGRPVLAPRPPSAKAKYLSRLAEARQKQFGKDNEITPTQTLVSPRSESVAMSPAHVSGQSPPSSSQIAMAVRVTAAQKAVLAGIQATLENQAPQILGGSNLSTPKANEIARTIKLLNSSNLVALKSITAPEVRAMLL